MYHVETIDIGKKHPMFPYLDYACLCANNMYNVANFHIRNLMTGLHKEEHERAQNERNVLRLVSESVPAINERLMEKYEARKKRIEDDEHLSGTEKAKRIDALKFSQFPLPTADKWFAGYGLLDALFRFTKNPDYLSFHSHVTQHAVKDCCLAWKAYFALLKTPSLSGRPKIPRYKKSGGRSTAVFSYLACSVKHGQLRFPVYEKKRYCLPVSSLPHASKDKLIEVRVMPYYGMYQVQIVTDDGIDEQTLIPSTDGIVTPDTSGTTPSVLSIDLGLRNFAAMADNRGNVPVVIKGGAVKAENQWYNKRMAFLKAEQMKGHDPKKSRFPATKQMKRISRKRDNFFRDTFYKYAHYIFRLMEKRGLSYLIVGYNKGQKDGISLGHKNNQAFVQIPFHKFRSILKTVSYRYGIAVIEQEESYTSKASFPDNDPMPVYGEEGRQPAFSGVRKGGLYRTANGRLINADVNGAANIARKHDPLIFPKGMSADYICGTVVAVKHSDILRISQEYKRNPGHTGQRACVCPVSA